MSIQTKIEVDLTSAIKSKDEQSRTLLRTLKSNIKNQEIEKKDKLNEEDIIKILQKEIKQKKDSIADYQKGGRKEMVEKENKEIKLIGKYLPKMMGKETVQKITEETIKETKASSLKDFGQVMKALMPKLKGQADGKMVSEIVKKALN